MSDNIQALAVLLERETTERDNLISALQQAQARAQAARQQAEQLHAYRDDYHRRWASQFRTAGTMDIVRCYQDFAQRLEEAIAQQARVATHAETQVQRAREGPHRAGDPRGLGAQADRAPPGRSPARRRAPRPETDRRSRCPRRLAPGRGRLTFLHPCTAPPPC
nr:flagellar export protein FliJ [Aquincola sp. J276]